VFTRKVIRSIMLPVIVATHLSSTIANAEPDQLSGERRGPPPEAIEVCTDQSEGAACTFSGHRGDVTGSCIVPPTDQNQLVCAPEGGPPHQQGRK
jgi:hypothetical protein